MKHYCTHVKDDGFIISTLLLSSEEIQEFDGILLVDIQPPNGDVGINCPIRPKWDGQNWIEGATQKEIDDFIDSRPIPRLSEIEELRIEQAQANSELVQLIMLMMGGA